MNYGRISAKLYGEPWLIMPDVHRRLGIGLSQYLEGGRPAEMQAAAGQHLGGGGQGIEGVHELNGLARLRIDGIMAKHLSLMEVMCAGGYDTARLESQLQQLEAREDIHTVLTSLHTPGGSAMGVGELADLFERLGQSKRTVAMVDGMAGSAGYWLAAAHQEIYCLASAPVGSIGCYAAITDESRAWEQEGLALHEFRSAPMKARGAPGTVITAEDRERMQARVDEAGGRFKAAVVRLRPGVDPEALSGDHFTGSQGLELGLVDGLRTSEGDLIDELLASMS